MVYVFVGLPHKIQPTTKKWMRQKAWKRSLKKFTDPLHQGKTLFVILTLLNKWLLEGGPSHCLNISFGGKWLVSIRTSSTFSWSTEVYIRTGLTPRTGFTWPSEESTGYMNITGSKGYLRQSEGAWVTAVSGNQVTENLQRGSFPWIGEPADIAEAEKLGLLGSLEAQRQKPRVSRLEGLCRNPKRAWQAAGRLRLEVAIPPITSDLGQTPALGSLALFHLHQLKWVKKGAPILSFEDSHLDFINWQTAPALFPNH